MTNKVVSELLDTNRCQAESGRAQPLSDSEEINSLLITCSMMGRPSDRLWPIPQTARVSEVSVLGNQLRVQDKEGYVLNPDVSYLLDSDEIEVIVVVGHTDCEIMARAYDEYSSRSEDDTNVSNRLQSLKALVREAIESKEINQDVRRDQILQQLVEYNVSKQIEYLSSEYQVPVVAGYVYDRHGAYGKFGNKNYLVNLNGERDPTVIRSHVPTDESVAVASVLN